MLSKFSDNFIQQYSLIKKEDIYMNIKSLLFIESDYYILERNNEPPDIMIQSDIETILKNKNTGIQMNNKIEKEPKISLREIIAKMGYSEPISKSAVKHIARILNKEYEYYGKKKYDLKIKFDYIDRKIINNQVDRYNYSEIPKIMDIIKEWNRHNHKLFYKQNNNYIFLNFVEKLNNL